MEQQAYTAKELVELALAGHYLINDEIDSTVRKLAKRFGAVGRERMICLPDLAAYADVDEIDRWSQHLRDVEIELEAGRPKIVDPNQPQLFE